MALEKGLRPLQVVLAIVIVRIISVFIVQTWYVPDEYWQSLEVAHKQAFGYGELTWEWKKGIRSYLYPSIIAGLYTILKFTGLDYPEALIILPRILQALLSAAADYNFYKWTGGRKWALFLIMTSWFWFYTSSRTLSQTAETALVAIALSVFPFKSGYRSIYEQESTKWIWLACLSVFIRPTSAPLWIVLGAYQLYTTNQGRLRLLVRTYVPIGLITAGCLIAIDSYFHGNLIVTPWEFFKVNVLLDIASFYGTHPWHWYLSQGIPAVLGINLLPVLISAYTILRRPRENKINLLLLTAIAVYVAIYSIIPHKEFRFVLPLVPVFLYLAQDVIVPWSRKATKWQLYLFAGSILIGNLVPATYFGLIHQRATLDVMPILRTASTNTTKVLFMTPCHSTPLYSHLHLNISARYLHCEPPAKGEVYESEAFYNNPLRWWKTEYSMKQTPDLLVLFDVLRGRVETLLTGYTQIADLQHTQFPDGEVGANLLVYQKITRKPVSNVDAQ